MDDRHARHRRTGTDRRRRPVEGYRATSTDRFDRLVNDAISSLPKPLLTYLDDVQLMIADIPPVDSLDSGEQLALGLYQAASPSGRGRRASRPPDRLTLFRRPIEARAHDKRDLIDLIQETVVHELAHHHGIDDDRLDELGWGR